jgi:hypothetical protein
MKIILNFLKVKKNKTYLLKIIIYKYLLKEYFLSLLAETKKIVHFQMTNNLVWIFHNKTNKLRQLNFKIKQTNYFILPLKIVIKIIIYNKYKTYQFKLKVIKSYKSNYKKK